MTPHIAPAWLGCVRQLLVSQRPTASQKRALLQYPSRFHLVRPVPQACVLAAQKSTRKPCWRLSCGSVRMGRCQVPITRAAPRQQACDRTWPLLPWTPHEVAGALAFSIVTEAGDGSLKVRRGEDWHRSQHNLTVLDPCTTRLMTLFYAARWMLVALRSWRFGAMTTRESFGDMLMHFGQLVLLTVIFHSVADYHGLEPSVTVLSALEGFEELNATLGCCMKVAKRFPPAAAMELLGISLSLAALSLRHPNEHRRIKMCKLAFKYLSEDRTSSLDAGSFAGKAGFFATTCAENVGRAPLKPLFARQHATPRHRLAFTLHCVLCSPLSIQSLARLAFHDRCRHDLPRVHGRALRLARNVSACLTLCRFLGRCDSFPHQLLSPVEQAPSVLLGSCQFAQRRQFIFSM